MTERDFQRTVIDLARLKSWMAHHCRPAVLPSGKWATHIQGDAGFFDLVLIKEGRVIFAELKAEDGKLSKAQQAWQDAAGWPVEVYVWRPSDFDRIVEILS